MIENDKIIFVNISKYFNRMNKIKLTPKMGLNNIIVVNKYN